LDTFSEHLGAGVTVVFVTQKVVEVGDQPRHPPQGRATRIIRDAESDKVICYTQVAKME